MYSPWRWRFLWVALSVSVAGPGYSDSVGAASEKTRHACWHLINETQKARAVEPVALAGVRNYCSPAADSRACAYQ